MRKKNTDYSDFINAMDFNENCISYDRRQYKLFFSKEKENTEPAPLQSNSNEYGYCYIGKTNNVRNCAKVSSRNKCMSGDIFPTMDLCINPNLRN